MAVRVPALAVAVVVCAGLAGCGGSGPDVASRADTTDTCAIVTPTKKCPPGKQVTASGFLTKTVWQPTTKR